METSTFQVEKGFYKITHFGDWKETSFDVSSVVV